MLHRQRESVAASRATDVNTYPVLIGRERAAHSNEAATIVKSTRRASEVRDFSTV
jgi:hypothetical protein